MKRSDTIMQNSQTIQSNQCIQEQLDTLKIKLASGARLAVAFIDCFGYAEFFGSGVKPLLTAITKAAPLLSGAVCADRVVGKAAALLFVYANVSFVYGETMSESALQILTANAVPHAFQNKVPFIQNRAGDGQCPMELLCADTSSPLEAFKRLSEKIGGVMG